MFLLSPAAHFWPGVVGSLHFFCLYLNFVGPFLCVWRSHWALWHWKGCMASFSFHQVWKFQINVELVHYYTLQKADTVMDMHILSYCSSSTHHTYHSLFSEVTQMCVSLFIFSTQTHTEQSLFEVAVTRGEWHSNHLARSGCVVLSWHSGDEDAALCSFWILW